jgi:hypothetical protein
MNNLRSFQPEPKYFFLELPTGVFIITQHHQGPPISSLLSGHLGSPVVDYPSLLLSTTLQFSPLVFDHHPFSHLHHTSEALFLRSYHLHSSAFLWAFKLSNPHSFSLKKPWLVSFSLKNRTAEELLALL